MAEFAEVIRQWKRMCEAQFECDRCPVDRIGCCRNVTSLSKDVEKTVMSWASEHPEPVYPTWGEWLEKQEVAGIDGCFETENGNLPIYRMTTKIWQPIPADMAQKLGIEPK